VPPQRNVPPWKVIFGGPALLLLLGLGYYIYLSWGLGPPSRPGSNGRPALRRNLPPSTLPHDDQPQPAPAPLQEAKDPLRWAVIRPNGADQPGAPPLQLATLVGNFDHDADQECLLFTQGGDFHWLCEANGSRRPVQLPGFASRGCIAVDTNGDGVDELVAGSTAVQDPDEPALSPALDLQGQQIGSVPWAGLRYFEPLLQGQFDSRPGVEYVWLAHDGARIMDLTGRVLQTLGSGLPPGGFSGPLHVVGDFDGDGVEDCFVQYEIQAGNDVQVQLEYGNALVPLQKAKPFSEGRNSPLTHYCADVDGDGTADVIYPGGYLSHRRGWITFALPGRMNQEYGFFEAGLEPGRFVIPAGLLAGDFDHDGKAEIVFIGKELTPAPDSHGQPVPYSELWFFNPAGKLLRGIAQARTVLPTECWVLHAAGKDHLVLAYTDEVRISQ
jgi:hypothetical protein